MSDDRYILQPAGVGGRSLVIDTHGHSDQEMHEPISQEEIVKRLNDDEVRLAAAPRDFTHDDPDLEALLNATAALLSRRANMDTGIMWKDALDAVEARLALSRAVIVQAVKPGDVVFLESTRELRHEEIEHMMSMLDKAVLGVRVVVLPEFLKVAPAPKE